MSSAVLDYDAIGYKLTIALLQSLPLAANHHVKRAETVPSKIHISTRHATGSTDALRPTTANGEYNYYFTVSNTPAPICKQGEERTLPF